MKLSFTMVTALLVLGTLRAGQNSIAVSRKVTPWSNLPPPSIMDGIGNANLKITTSSPRAQAYFNQGLRLLHCFWYFEAYRAFKEVARLDPSAAMAYWGMAEALMNFPKMEEGEKAAIEKAESLMDKVSDHEQYYIRAAADLTGGQGGPGRVAYVHEMQALIHKYPDDLNAPAFLAYFVMSGYGPDGRPAPGELFAETLLRHILISHPDNVAANHYWIHAVEGGPRPEEGLKSAELLLKLAPNSGHLAHMAGHIYYRLGDYEKARKAFVNSMSVDEAYMAREHVPPQDDANYEHNLSYLVAACAEEGRYKEALHWVNKLDGLPASPAYGASTLNYAIPVGSTLLRLHLRFSDWRAAASDPTDFGVDPISMGFASREYQRGWYIFAKGMEALERKSGKANVAEARDQVLALQTLLDQLNKQEATAPELNSFWIGGAVHLLEVALTELQGNLKSAEGENAEAYRLLKSAIEKEEELGYTEPPYYARPVEETLGNVCLQAHAWELARQAFNQELRLRPKSGFALFGIARSYGLEGSVPEATHAYKTFLAAWRYADRNLPQVRTAEAWLTSHGSQDLNPRTP